jgi:hypothetical protein
MLLVFLPTILLSAPPLLPVSPYQQAAAAAAAGAYTAGCPNRGCGPGSNFHVSGPGAAAARLPAAAPSSRWTWRAKHAGAYPQCTVAQQGGVVCTGNLTGSLGGIVSLSPSNGTQEWLDSTLDATQASPVLSTVGAAISCDGRALVGTEADGRPIGPPVALFMPPVYSLDLTIESIIPLLPQYNSKCSPQCGSIVTYASDGVPHASASLNDSQTGEGFNAASAPLFNVANQTKDSTTRIYIITALILSSADEDRSRGTSLIPCRLQAWDVASTMNDRLVQAWSWPFWCTPPDWESETSPPLPAVLVRARAPCEIHTVPT